ncbi:hypothetical protein J7T55_003317 [Diaporthe amygdali]|uniref:uncharacterized protein n=1 Tax=Phomopsis amygdali TaxID=1214568 RepID=UPI0022FF2666|nr:uncharacterized protein J7T55_003317 [Diaporthe amygdali]KAJ0116903.1 hypothetical protein J7T55_003317 [Diaporthe amygdali]
MTEGKKTVLITGCSDGSLGSALALAFHAAGWRVFATARNPAKLSAVHAAGIECETLDVQDAASITAAASHVRALTGGSLDALVNNAGVGYSMSVTDSSLPHIHTLFELNVYSIISVTRAFLPLLLQSTARPLIANNTSAMGLLGCGMPFQGGYSASKAAATSLTEALRLELAPFGIRVCNIVTGRVRSTFFDNSNDAVLPPESIFNLAKDAIEDPMNGRNTPNNREDPNHWAANVVRDLSQPNPPYLVCRGGLAGSGRIVSFLPLGALDSHFKKASGLDVLDQKIRERGGWEKMREANKTQSG